MNESTKDSLINRLAARSKEDRACAANSSRVLELLQPELDRFDARTEYNTYAVRLALEHRNGAKRDAAFADDLEAAIAALSASGGGVVATLPALWRQRENDNGEDYTEFDKGCDQTYAECADVLERALAAAPKASEAQS